MPVPPAPGVRKTVSGTEPAPMKTRMAVPMTSAVSFWSWVGDDMGSSPLPMSTGSTGRADVGGELGRQRRDRLIGVRAIGGERDAGRRPDRETEQRDQALGVGLPAVLADDDPAGEPAGGLDEPGCRPGM